MTLFYVWNRTRIGGGGAEVGISWRAVTTFEDPLVFQGFLKIGIVLVLTLYEKNTTKVWTVLDSCFWRTMELKILLYHVDNVIQL